MLDLAFDYFHLLVELGLVVVLFLYNQFGEPGLLVSQIERIAVLKL